MCISEYICRDWQNFNFCLHFCTLFSINMNLFCIILKTIQRVKDRMKQELRNPVTNDNPIHLKDTVIICEIKE